MPSLKKLIQAILDLFVKKADTAFIAKQSLPKTTANSQQSATGKGTYEGFISPVDGFVCFYIAGYVNDASTMRGRVTVNGNAISMSTFGNGAAISCTVSCQKGDDVQFNIPTGQTYTIFWTECLGAS